MSAAGPNFRSVVLDVDSTLSGIEGIDWLAARKGAGVAELVAAMTSRAMTGEVPLESVYAERLAAVVPTLDDIGALAEAYVENAAADAKDAMLAWRDAGVRVVMVSGGIRGALLRLADHLGVAPSDVYAVTVRHDVAGGYSGYDTTSPLSVATGKREIVESLSLPRPILSVGDGSTDLEMKQVTDAFAAYTGFAARPSVTARADFVVASFDELRKLVGV